MSESGSVSISSEEVESKAREIVVRLRDIERRASSEDPKVVYQELKSVIGEARKYGLDRCFIPLVRKNKRIIEERRIKMMKEKFKSGGS